MKARAWCFTINNYTDADIDAVKAVISSSAYGVCGREVGEDCGTPHLQGYVYFKSQRHLTAMKGLLPRAHLEPAKGSAQQNHTYCTKDGDIVIEHGDMPRQGKRSDLEVARELVEAGFNAREVAAQVTSLQSLKAAQVLFTLMEPERDWKPEVRWYWGASGSGKTRTAREWLGKGCYTALDNLKWWDGYDAHEDILIDDFRPGQCSFVYLLRILDRYPMRIECKGGSRQLLAKRIAVTSIQSPTCMYEEYDEPIEQLTRRIDEIILV